MFFLSFFRIIKFSFQDIFRNIWLSIVTVVILILTLFTINMILVVKTVGQSAVDAVKERVDMNIYLKASASEEEIDSLKNRISTIEGIKDIEYISSQDALDFFRSKYKDKPEVIDALREIGKNPLNPSLVIKPENTEDPIKLTKELNEIESEIIESRDFADHKIMLGKINNITSKVSEIGIMISLIFALTTILVVYYAIRMAIHDHRREIAIMKLVGASNPFVYMPFVLSGIIYAVLGVLAVAGIFYPFLNILQPYMEVFFMDFNVDIVSYFDANFLMIFGIQLGVVALINVVASLIAVKKYSNV